MTEDMQSGFCKYEVTDTRILLLDLDQGRSVTNDAANVIEHLQSTLPGAIGPRRVFYRDTSGRFDELVVKHGVFAGFKPCSDGQQASLSEYVDA